MGEGVPVGRDTLLVLGAASSVVTPNRSHASFALVRGSGDVWLVDAGPSVVDRLLHVGIDPRAVVHVFVTHQHGDHLLGVPMLNNARWDRDPDASITVHGPRPALDALRTVTLAVYPDHADRLDRLVTLHAHPAEGSATPVQETVADTPVRSAPARHGVPAVGYRFDLRDGSVVFTGDSAPTESIVRLAAGASLLVHDATFAAGRMAASTTAPDHSTPREAGAVAAAAAVERLALVHLPPESVGREADLVDEAAESFGGSILVPADGDELAIGDQLPGRDDPPRDPERADRLRPGGSPG